MKVFEKPNLRETGHPPLPGEGRNSSLFDWTRRKVVCGSVVFLFILLMFLGGPGFRGITRAVVLHKAKAAGLVGNLKITGSLWSGFAVRDMSLQGKDGAVRKLALREAKVEYVLRSLITGFSEWDWLRLAEVNYLDLHLVLPGGGKMSRDESPPPKHRKAKVPADFSPVWNLFSADLALHHLSATVEVGEDIYTLEDFSLSLPRDLESRLAIGNLKVPGMDGCEDLELSIIKGERSIAIGPVRLGKSLEIKKFAFAESSPGIFDLDTVLHAGNADLAAHYSSAGAARLSMTDGLTLDLGKILGDNSPFRGILSNLKIDFTGDPTRPQTWKLFGIGQFDQVSWKGFVVDSAALRIVGEDATLTLERSDATVMVKAHFPFEGESFSSAAVTVNAEVAVSSLDSFLESVAPNIPVDGSLIGGISDLQIVNGKTVKSGSAFLKTGRATWVGQSVDGIDLSAEVTRPDHLDFRAKAALNGENAANFQGSLDIGNLVYDSSGKVKITSDQSLTGLLAYFRADGKFSGEATADWTGSGDLKKKEHSGSLSLDLPGVRFLKGLPCQGKISAVYNGKSAEMTKIALSNDAISIKGTAKWSDHKLTIPSLIASDKSGERMNLSAEIPFEVPSGERVNFLMNANQLAISSLASFVRSDLPLDGTLTGSMQSSGSLSKLDTAARFDFLPDFKTADENSKLALEFHHTGNVSIPSTWDMKLDALMSGLKWKETRLENLSLHVATKMTKNTAAVSAPGIKAEVKNTALVTLALNQSSAKVDASASIGLGNDVKSLAREPISVQGTILVERVEQFIRDFTENSATSLPLAGGLSLQLAGVELSDGSFRKGTLDLNSSNLSMAGTPLGAMLLKAEVTSPDYIEARLSLPLDEKSTIEGSGVYDVKAGGYAGKLAVAADLKSPGKLRSILAERNFAELLPATTSLNWEGRGSVSEKVHLGNFEASGTDLLLAAGAKPVGFALQGSYTEKSVTIPSLEVKSPALDLNGSLEWKDNLLQIPSLTGMHAGKKVIHLAASLPLDGKKMTPQLWFQQDAGMKLDLEATDLPVAEMVQMFRAKPALNGTLNTSIHAGGSPNAPEIEGDLALSQIVVAREEKNLPAGQLSLNLIAKGEKAVLKGKYLHPDVKPFAIDASVPFHPGEWASGERNFSDEPVQASAKMDQSSLAFLASQFPGIEDVIGTVALDVGLSGSLNEPKILGNGAIDVTRLRLENRNAPTFYDIDSAIRFADNSLIVDRLHAIVAGGVVDLSGTAFLDGKNPRLDFSLTGREVLVARTPDLNVRTDADLTLTGPWQEARLAGSLGITNSRFYKNIDLFPIGLPSRQRSALPTVERISSGGGPSRVDLDLGVSIDPFKNWPVTVHISTKDPFLIRGNLAQSEVEVDVVIVGTLGAPVPKGVVKIKEGELTLPFSKVDVEVGKVVFNAQTGFNGALEFKARARAGEHRINIYAFNRILEPKYVLTSSPPMPPEDIMTLLATGTTRDELIGSDAGSVAASKAAMLFLKNLKKSGAVVDQEPSLLDQLQDRTELELGKIDPRSGVQTFGGKIRLWKQFFFVGDVDAQNDYRALLKYVFQYR